LLKKIVIFDKNRSLLMKKSILDKRLLTERRVVAAIRDKMDALAHAQFLKKRKSPNQDQKKGCDNGLSKTELRKLRKSKANYLKSEIDLLLRSLGLTPHQHDSSIPKATAEESLMIRFDFDGIMHRPRTGDFSESYLRHKQLNVENFIYEDDALVSFFSATDYQLSDSPAWNKMKKFANFRQLRKRICRQLAESNIPPSIVSEMNYYDFVDIIIDISKKSGSRPFESSRSKHLKMFAACYGQEFTEIMTALRVKPQVTRSILSNMRKGICGELLDLHHKTNVTNFHELENPYTINDFSNMLLTFIHPHHRSLHFGNGYDINQDIIFFGGYDPAFQIVRDPQREMTYLQTLGQGRKNGRVY